MADGSELPGASRPLSRRRLLQGAGLAAAAGTLGRPLEALARESDVRVRVQGPGAVPVVLHVNGEERRLSVEPRVTLLEALREPPLSLTGAKPVCDRGACGACTVWLDDLPVPSCSVLAVEAEGRRVTTVEGVADGPLPLAFVAEDALQCGFCTPGMVMSCAWAVRRHGRGLTEEQAREATAGNLCRCGTYPHVLRAALRAAKGA